MKLNKNSWKVEGKKKISAGLNEERGGGDSIIGDLCSITVTLNKHKPSAQFCKQTGACNVPEAQSQHTQ